MELSEILWLVAFVAFLVTEAGTVSLVSIWFAAGALAALVASWLGGPVWLQIVLFLAVSCGLLGCLRPIVRKYISPRITRTNVDGIINSIAVVTEEIDNLAAQGQVSINGVSWTARSSDGNRIPSQTTVRVDKIEGVKVFVSPVTVAQQI